MSSESSTEIKKKQKLPKWAIIVISVSLVAVVIVIVVVLSVELTKPTTTSLITTVTPNIYSQKICPSFCAPPIASIWSLTTDGSTVLSSDANGNLSMAIATVPISTNQTWIFNIISLTTGLNQGIYNLVNAQYSNYALCANTNGTVGLCPVSLGSIYQQWFLYVLSDAEANPFLSFALVSRSSGLALTISPQFSIYLSNPDNNVYGQRIVGQLLQTTNGVISTTVPQ